MSDGDDAHYWRVQARHATDPDGLLDACRQAAALAPDDAPTLAELGRLLVEDHPGEAVKLLDRALVLAPDDLTSRYNRACAHARRRDRDATLADLRVCFDAQPEDAEDAAGDVDLARFHTDRGFMELLAQARTRRGALHLPPGLRIEIAQSRDEAFAVVPAPPNGIVMLRIAHYPHGADRLSELTSVAPPPAITPDDCAAYGARLAAAASPFPDLHVSAAALGTTRDGICGWVCGVARVWRVDDRAVVSPSPYVEVPPGVELPAGISELHHLIRRAVSGKGAIDPGWFEARGKTFAFLMTHPLPEEPESFEYAQGIDDLARTITCGIAGWWLRP